MSVFGWTIRSNLVCMYLLYIYNYIYIVDMDRCIHSFPFHHAHAPFHANTLQYTPLHLHRIPYIMLPYLAVTLPHVTRHTLHSDTWLDIQIHYHTILAHHHALPYITTSYHTLLYVSAHAYMHISTHIDIRIHVCILAYDIIASHNAYHVRVHVHVSYIHFNKTWIYVYIYRIYIYIYTHTNQHAHAIWM